MAKDGRPRRSQNLRLGFGTGDRVRAVFDGGPTSSPGALIASSVRLSLCGNHSYYLDSSKVFLLLTFAGGQNDNNKVKTVLHDKSDAEI